MAACNFVKIGAILLAVVSAVCAIERMEMTVDNPLVRPGDNVTIRYNVFGMDLGEFVRLEKVFDDKEPMLISTNHIPEGLIKDLDRYHIFLDEEGSNIDEKFFKFEFIITDAKEEDSGVFQIIGTGADEKPTITVNVIRDAQKIEMFFGSPGSESKISDGQEFEFEDEQEQTIRCVVSGSNPAADVIIYRGDDDITDLFERTVSTEKTPTQAQGLEIISNTVTLEAASVLIDYSFARKPLKCVGKVEGSDTELSQSITVKFQGFAPHFDCAEAITSFVGDKNLNITCRVTASPAVEPEDAYVYWHMMEGENKPTDPTDKVGNGETYGHYSANIYREGDQETVMVLSMERLYPQMARTHFFVAKNEFGTAEHGVKIERDTAREVSLSDNACVLSSSLLVTVIAALISSLVH